MNKGALLYAFDSKVKYTKLAIKCAKRIKKYLKLPVSIVTDTKVDSDIFDNTIIVPKPITNNRHERRTWYNADRSSAFDYSPYDKTLLVDTDYMVNGTTLLPLFDSAQPLLAYKTVQPIFKSKRHVEKFGTKNTVMWWATLVIFDRTNFVRDVFDIWKMVENNYYHYANLFGFDARQFRNDFALSIALLLCNGNTIADQCNIPWPLFNVDKEIQVDFDGKWWLKHTTRCMCIQNTDLHIMGKQSLEKLNDL